MSDYSPHAGLRGPKAPCHPRHHKFAMNGQCWACQNYRDDLTRNAELWLQIRGYGVTEGPVSCPRCYWVFTPEDSTAVVEPLQEIQFRGSGRQLAAECLALLRDKPQALQEFCETLGAPIPNDETES